MPDFIDRAQDHIEREAPHIIARSRKPVLHHANGKCHNCDEAIDQGLYCNADCRDDFEKRQRIAGGAR